MWYCEEGYVCLYQWVSICLIKIKVMMKYEKELFEVLINYIPKISNSLEGLVDELVELNNNNQTFKKDK